MTTKAATAEGLNYATVADVQALTPARKFGQGTNPTNANVHLYIELAEATINGVLIQKGYVVPVSETESPVAFSLLRRICLQGAVAQIEVSSGNGPNIERTRAVYEKSLERLEDARFVLNAPKDEERAKPRGPGVTQVAALEDNEVGEGREPFFKRSSLGRRGMSF
jgi:hypothetical protein